MRITVFLLLLVCSFASGVDVKHSDGFHIRAISTETSLRTGTTQYIGNVVLTRGTTRFEADQITEYRNGNQLQRIVAEGNPAIYRDENARVSDIVYGVAKRVEYIAGESKVVLRDFELRDRDGNTSKAENGTYILKAD